MDYAERDRVKLAFDASGAGYPPLLFVHGWACDRSFFSPQVVDFSRSYRTVNLDLRGHGDSDKPREGFDIESLADDLVAVAVAAELDRPVVLGHSLGGLVALAVAARPGAARAAVLIDPVVIVPSDDVRDQIRGAAANIGNDTDGVWRKSFAEGMFLPSDRVRREETIALMSSGPPAVAAATMRSIADFDGEATLRRCDVPLLSIGSAAPMNDAKALREAAPTIAIGQTVGAGHFNQLEVPDQVNAMIRKFLAVTCP